MNKSTTVGEAIKDLSGKLANVGIADSMREARLIVASVFGIPMSRLTLSMNSLLSADDVDELYKIAKRRLERRPLSHVTGKRSFFKHEFCVGPEVLDPRPETETLVVAALSEPFETVLDLGVGSGAILISLLAERSEVRGVGTDLSPEALSVATANARNLRVAGRCHLMQSDWFENVDGKFDLILSNPPYISVQEMNDLEPELAFEPRVALTDEQDGLSAYKKIIPSAGAFLTKGGRLLVEIGWEQKDAVVKLFRKGGFESISVLPDLDGRDRVVEGYWLERSG